jgi:GTP-sensing pleiotropic transcriptional regulator CodY
MNFMIVGCNDKKENAGPSKNGIDENNTPHTDIKKNNILSSSNYIHVKRHRVIDQNGLSQAVEATSFLIPADWEVNSEIKWNLARCFSDMLQTSVYGISKDKSFEVYIFPIKQTQWADNAVYISAMKTGQVGLGCTIDRPLDASNYIDEELAKLVNGRAVKTSKLDQIEKYMRNNSFSNNYGNGMGVRIVPSAAEGFLEFEDGSKGLAYCIANNEITSAPDYTTGGTSNTYQNTISMRMVIKYKDNKEKEARSIINTLISSQIVNPVWENAVTTLFQNIKQNIQNETWKRIQITQQAQQEISNNIVRSWESKANIKSNNNPSFNDYIRGVDKWEDSSGNTIELNNGYDYAWQNNDGSYILSNEHGFDPNTTHTGTWTSLKK